MELGGSICGAGACIIWCIIMCGLSDIFCKCCGIMLIWPPWDMVVCVPPCWMVIGISLLPGGAVIMLFPSKLVTIMPAVGVPGTAPAIEHGGMPGALLTM